MKFGEWKIWNGGGECPVDPDVKVQVQFKRDDRFDAEDREPVKADGWMWIHTGSYSDIIAYREVIEPNIEYITRVVPISYGLKTCTLQIQFGTQNGEVDKSIDPVAEWLI